MRNKSIAIKYIFLSILALAFLNNNKLTAQVRISGSVYDEENLPMENVLVMLHEVADSSVIRFTVTDKNGFYNIDYIGTDFNLLISISRMDIKRQVKSIIKRNQRVNFISEKDKKQLDEIEIVDHKQWRSGDTLNYLIPAYMDRNDVLIGDVMRRIPGMRVNENGTVSYRGRLIRSLHIEDMDMANGRYGVMTNTIAAKDVQIVQIVESDQPIKLLRKTHYSDDVVVNIKLTEEAKGKRKANTTIGLGGDLSKKPLWQGELVAMQIGNKNQHLFSYKSNNSGIDVRREQGSNARYFPISRQPFTNMLTPSPPDINLKHYFFNSTHAITSQNYYKANDNNEWIYNLRYNFNKEPRNSFSRTSYTIPGEKVKVFEEDISTKMKTHKLDGDVLYKYNTEKTYFNNFFNVAGAWEDGTGEIVTTSPLKQKYKTHSFEAVNNTHLVKKRKRSDNGIDLNLTQAFLSKPHQLNIRPGLYKSEFNNNEEYAELEQQVNYSSFTSGNKLSFLNAITLWGISINPAIHANIQTQHLTSGLMTSVLDGQPLSIIEDPKMQNDIDWLRANIGVSLEMRYNTKNFNFNLVLPFTHNYFRLQNKTKKDNMAWIEGTYQPSLYMNLRLSNRWNINTSANMDDYTPNIRRLYSGYILQNYRTLNYYESEIYSSENVNTTTRLAYRNSKRQFLSTLSFSFQQYNSNGIYGQVFEGNLSATKLKMARNIAQSYRLHLDVSKGLDWQKLLLTGLVSIGKSNRDVFRQNILLTSYSEWGQVKLSANMTTISGIGIRLSSEWFGSVAQEANGPRHSVMHSIDNSLRVDFSILKNINIFSACDYYFTRSKNGDKHFAIFDIGMQYTHAGVKYSLLWNNILNTKNYISSYYANMNSYYSEYKIRPASIMFNVQFNLF